MALSKSRIDAIITQLSKLGDDEVAFELWVDGIAPELRAHGHVPYFRVNVRSLWRSKNKKGVYKIVRELFEGPTLAEKYALEQERESPKSTYSDSDFYRFLSQLGICEGDVLTVHSESGEVVSLKFSGGGKLPKRKRAKITETEEEIPPTKKGRPRKKKKSVSKTTPNG